MYLFCVPTYPLACILKLSCCTVVQSKYIGSNIRGSDLPSSVIWLLYWISQFFLHPNSSWIRNKFNRCYVYWYSTDKYWHGSYKALGTLPSFFSVINAIQVNLLPPCISPNHSYWFIGGPLSYLWMSKAFLGRRISEKRACCLCLPNTYQPQRGCIEPKLIFASFHDPIGTSSMASSVQCMGNKLISVFLGVFNEELTSKAFWKCKCPVSHQLPFYILLGSLVLCCLFKSTMLTNSKNTALENTWT